MFLLRVDRPPDARATERVRASIVPFVDLSQRIHSRQRTQLGLEPCLRCAHPLRLSSLSTEARSWRVVGADVGFHHLAHARKLCHPPHRQLRRPPPLLHPRRCHPCARRDPTRNLQVGPCFRWDNTSRKSAVTRATYKLIPAPQPHAILSSSRAPKRDHDEWLVRGRLGGSGVVPGQAESTSAWVSSLAKPLTTHGAPDAGCSRGQGRHA